MGAKMKWIDRVNSALDEMRPNLRCDRGLSTIYPLPAQSFVGRGYLDIMAWFHIEWEEVKLLDDKGLKKLLKTRILEGMNNLIDMVKEDIANVQMLEI